jgi:hypothetical protein
VDEKISEKREKKEGAEKRESEEGEEKEKVAVLILICVFLEYR